MAYWHSNLHKRKKSGGKKRPLRKQRKSERGGFPAETALGERKLTRRAGLGGTEKLKLLRASYANVSNRASGKTERLKINRVVSNRANVDYDRTGVITKGAVIETSAGNARVTSKLGGDGVINAVAV